MSGTDETTTTPAAAPSGRSLADRASSWLRALVRDPNPILVKELRSTFRANLFVRFLYLSTGLVALVTLTVGALAASTAPPAEVGQIVFQFFFGAALTVICLVAPASAATSFTSEREQRTYESLILSGMRPWRIVWGKFLAAYASMFLVLVAQAPVVGIAFMFGGVSPHHVVIGYGALVLVLAPAVAFGVALSARLKSTRIAILIATLVFSPVAFFSTLFLWIAGEEMAKSAWGLTMGGPFWFTEAIVSRATELDTLGTLVALPLYVFGITVWFFLASAVAGVRPAAEDRSSPFKVWSVVSALGLVLMVGMLVTLFSGGLASARAGIVFAVIGGFVLVFYALLFANEPPLPPRLADERSKGTVLRPLFVLLGPGAAPTLRFAWLLVLGTSVALAGAASLGRHFAYPGFAEHAAFDGGLLVIAVGHAAVAAFLAALAEWLRVSLRSGLAARVLTIAAFAALCIVPFLFSLILDPDSLQRMDDEIPLLVHITPLQPSILGLLMVEEEVGLADGLLVAIPAVAYGLGAAFFWVLVEAQARSARRADAERRRARDERMRTSQPPTPVLQRASAPPDPAPAGATQETAP